MVFSLFPQGDPGIQGYHGRKVRRRGREGPLPPMVTHVGLHHSIHKGRTWSCSRMFAHALAWGEPHLRELGWTGVRVSSCGGGGEAQRGRASGHQWPGPTSDPGGTPTTNLHPCDSTKAGQVLTGPQMGADDQGLLCTELHTEPGGAMGLRVPALLSGNSRSRETEGLLYK